MRGWNCEHCGAQAVKVTYLEDAEVIAERVSPRCAARLSRYAGKAICEQCWADVLDIVRQERRCEVRNRPTIEEVQDAQETT